MQSEWICGFKTQFGDMVPKTWHVALLDTQKDVLGHNQ